MYLVNPAIDALEHLLVVPSEVDQIIFAGQHLE